MASEEIKPAFHFFNNSFFPNECHEQNSPDMKKNSDYITISFSLVRNATSRQKIEIQVLNVMMLCGQRGICFSNSMQEGFLAHCRVSLKAL